MKDGMVDVMTIAVLTLNKSAGCVVYAVQQTRLGLQWHHACVIRDITELCCIPCHSNTTSPQHTTNDFLMRV